jgi:hypothetical protein
LYRRVAIDGALRDMVVVELPIILLRGFKFGRAGEMSLSDQLADAAIETLDHAVRLRMPRLVVQACVTALMYSGPLSHRMALGAPSRHSMIFSNYRITRSDGNEKSTSMAMPSRLKSSTALSSRMLRPLAS